MRVGNVTNRKRPGSMGRDATLLVLAEAEAGTLTKPQQNAIAKAMVKLMADGVNITTTVAEVLMALARGEHLAD